MTDDQNEQTPSAETPQQPSEPRPEPSTTTATAELPPSVSWRRHRMRRGRYR